MPLDKTQFTAAVESLPQFVDVPCPELGGELRLRRIDTAEAVEAARYVSQLADESGDVTDGDKLNAAKADLVARSAIDETGAKILDSEEGRAMLAGLPVGVLSRVYGAAERLNGLGFAVESAKKN